MPSDSKKKILQKKLAVLETGTAPMRTGSFKNRAERRKYWASMMESAKKDGDRLKASELLGRSNADFVERTRFEDAEGNKLEWIVKVVRVGDVKDPEEQSDASD